MTSASHVVFLQGQRTILRPITEADIPLMIRWQNDPEVRQFIARYAPLSEGAEREWVASLYRADRDIPFIVATLDHVPIGTMGLHRIKWVERTAVTGAAFGEKRYWNQGYGQDAKHALLQYAFDDLGLRKICSSAIAFNGRSLAYNQRCGFQIEGRRRQQLFRHGRYYDEVLLGVFRHQWERAYRSYLKRQRVSRRRPTSL